MINSKNKFLLILILVMGLLIIYNNASIAAEQTLTQDVNGTILTVTYDDGQINGINFDHDTGNDDTVLIDVNLKSGYGFVEWQRTSDGVSISESSPYELNINDYTEVTAIAGRVYTLTTDISGNGDINITPNKTEYFHGEQVTLTADPDAGYQFNKWQGSVGVDDTEKESITVTMNSDKYIIADFTQGKITNFEIGPRHIVREVDIREFEFRPEAVKEGQETPDDVTINFQFSANSPSIYVVKKDTGESVASVPHGNIVSGIDYEVLNERIILTSNFLTPLQKDVDFEIRLGNQSNGPVLATFSIKDSYARPRIDVTINDHPQYGTLEDGRLYYLKEKANLEVDVTAQSDIMSQRYIRAYSTDNNPQSLDRKVELTAFDWEEINGNTNISDLLNSNIQNSAWKIEDITPFSKAVNQLGVDNLQVMAVRMKAYASGAQTNADETYYFALDPEDPQGAPGTNPDFENDVEFGIIHNDQLKVSFHDAISGVDPDSIEAQAIKVDQNDDLETQRKFYANYTNGQFKSEAMEADPAIFFDITYDEDTQVALLKDNNLDEGRYIIRVIAADRAGNGQVGADEIGFTFSVTINQDKPLITGITLRDNSGNDLGKVVSNTGANLDFTVYMAEELRYQIRPVDGEWKGQTWTNLGKKIINDPQPLTDLLDDLADGDYEVIIVADDIELNPKIITYLESITPNPEADIEDDVKNKLKEHLSLNDAEWEDSYGERMAIRAFRFKVDKTAPVIGEEIEYYNQVTDSFEDPTGKIIYTSLPMFRINISDTSEIDNFEIDINGTLANVMKVEGDIVTFRPVNSLEAGLQTITIIATDKWGNTSEPRVFNDLFELRIGNDNALDIFNIEQGAELDINESSLIEIDFMKNEGLEITEDLLKITINNKLIFEDGQAQSDNYKITTFDNDGNGKVERILIFAKRPLPSGWVLLTVSAIKENEYTELYPQELGFTVKGERKGFGFGRLLINK